MSDWMEREERERFYAWCSDLGVDECPDCSALVRDVEHHEAWHELLKAES